MDNYIFGYGSLICKNSRSKTGNSGDALAVLVQDIERSWSVPVFSSKVTAVGAIEKPNSSCNGVIFQVSNEDLKKFDAREAEYNKIILTPDRFEFPDVIPKNANIWTYVGHEIRKPTQELPIAQSYLDVIMKGCLTFGPDFLDTFFNTTKHWQHLLNDRSAPRYPRNITSSDHHQHFDELILRSLPVPFANRK